MKIFLSDKIITNFKNFLKRHKNRSVKPLIPAETQYKTPVNTIYNSAFTLAEVLITLAIIGVVAAMTIPAVLSNYQKKETITRLKKVYSELVSALALSEVENGDKAFFDYSLYPYDFFNTYLSNYVKLTETTIQEAKSKDYKWLNISGSEHTGLSDMQNNAKIITLASGAQIFASTNALTGDTNANFGYVVDLNGFNKPNQFGKDLFYFVINRYKGVVPMYLSDGGDYKETPMKTREELMTGTGYGCNKQGGGMWCGALIMVDNWEIKSDYPW